MAKKKATKKSSAKPKPRGGKKFGDSGVRQ